ncbi:SIR2 family protein [Aliikangiella maris]
MWTHKKPYKKLCTTSERIQYWGEQELYRALNLKRVVGFIGSGVTTAYGRLTWGEFCRLIVMAVDDLYRNTPKNKNSFINKSHIDDLYRSLAQACGQELPNETSKTDSEYSISPTIDRDFSVDTALLELCSELAAALDKPRFVKQQTQQIMQASYLLQFEYRLKLLQGDGENSLYQKWRKDLHEFFKSVLSSDYQIQHIDEAADYFLSQLNSKTNKNSIDKIKTFFERKLFEKLNSHLKTKGYLTTIHIKIWELLKSSIAKDNNKSFPLLFCLLIKSKGEKIPWYIKQFIEEAQFSAIRKKDQNWPHPIKYIIETLGIRRILTLNYDLEFEHYFKEERSFHTEPWFVDPEHTDESAIERNHSALDGYGDRFYSVTPNNQSASDLIDFAALASHHDAYVFHLHGRVDCEEDLIITEYDYQQRYVKNNQIRQTFDEGMRTLFAGNDVLFLGIGMNEADLFRPMRQFISEGKRFMDHQDGIIAELSYDTFDGSENKKILDENAKNEKTSTRLKIQFGVKTLFYPNEIAKSELSKKQNAIIEVIKRKRSKHRVKELLSLMVVNRQIMLEQSKAFIKNIEKRETTQQKWFNDWKQKPKDKYGLLRNWGENNYVLWIRQRIYSPKKKHDEKDEKKFDGKTALNNPTLKKLKVIIEKAKLEKEPCPLIDNLSDSGRRIIRICGRKGIGKGSLIKELQKSHSHFLPSINGHFQHQHYRAAFFVDTHYSTEFNSVISSFIRFIAGRLAEVLGQNGKSRLAEQDPFSHELQSSLLGGQFNNISRLELLKRYIAQYSNHANQSTDRLFICLSGLDRITNHSGNGYNALHRAFFRILTDSGKVHVTENLFKRTPPFDIVLISGQQECPIRYLSQYDLDNIDSGYHSEQRTEKNISGELLNPQTAPLLHWYQLNDPVLTMEDIVNETILDDTQRKKVNEIMRYYQFIRQLASQQIFIGQLLCQFISNVINQNGTKSYQSIFEKLNFLINRDRQNGALDTILRYYYENDRQQFGSEWANLTALVLRRLVLFSLPIQRAVLADFPAIRNSLSKLYLREYPQFEEKQSLITPAILSDYLYRKVLITLEEKRLIIPIHDDGVGEIRNTEISNEPSTFKFQPIEVKAPFKYKRYTLHSTIREHLAKRMRYAAFDHGEHSFFDVSLYISQPVNLPSPSALDYREVGRVLQNIIEFSFNYFNPVYRWIKLNKKQQRQKGKELDKQEKEQLTQAAKDSIKKILEYDTLHIATHKLRAGFNLVSGSFSIGVISRLFHEESDELDLGGETRKPFDNYRSWIRGLLNAAVANDHFDDAIDKIFNSGQHDIDEIVKDLKLKNEQAKKFENIRKFIKQFKIQKPFYRTEIAWLYNERGLVNFLQGRLYEAITFFDSALEQINDDQWVCLSEDESQSAASTYRRIILNRAVARLEAGKLEDALDVLLSMHNQLSDKNRARPNQTLYWAKGYLGLCYHLNGRKNTAQKYYKAAIDYFADQPNHMRTLAIFRRHLADLYRSLNQLEKAQSLINQSISTATSADQQDILHHAFVSKARLINAADENTGTAMGLLNKAQQYAEKMGIYKLQVDCYTSKGELMLKQKQFDNAGRYLTNAIAIANKHGMKLRKIAALKRYGDLLEARGTDNRLLQRVRFVTQAQSEKTGLLHTLDQVESLDKRKI